MKQHHRLPLGALVFLWGGFIASASLARAQVTPLLITLTPGTDGGVHLEASGTSIDSFNNEPGDNSFTLYFDGDNVLGLADQGTSSTSAEGTVSMGDEDGPIVQMFANTYGGKDSLSFVASPADFHTGQITAVGVMADWSVGALPFASLTPGTFAALTRSGDPFNGVTLTIVPEPSSMALLLGAAVGLSAFLRRTRRRGTV